MTAKTKNTRQKAALSSFHLEASRSRAGMTLMVEGVVGIREFSDELLTLATHSGKISLRGSRLRISIYEGKCVEIQGRIEEISFGYGKT